MTLQHSFKVGCNVVLRDVNIQRLKALRLNLHGKIIMRPAVYKDYTQQYNTLTLLLLETHFGEYFRWCFEGFSLSIAEHDCWFVADR